MLITEKDALERWCPHARSFVMANINGHATEIVCNRDSPTGMIPSCIGSKCMAWRWKEAKRLKDIDLVTTEVVESGPRLGYCGLSGRPEFE